MTIAAGPIGAGPIGSSGGANFSMVVTHGTFTLSMQGAAKLITDIYPSGTFATSGQAVEFLNGYHFDIVNGAFVLSGQNAVGSLGKGLVADVGTFTYSGQPFDFFSGFNLTADVGTFAITGQTQDYEIHISLGDPVGTFTYTGQPVTFHFLIDPETGVFTYSGQTVSLKVARKIVVDTAEFILTMQDFKIKGWFSPFVPPEIWTDAA